MRDRGGGAIGKKELGIDKANAAKIDEVKQLRPLADDQPWGIFFVKFEPKQLPVVALRRLLNWAGPRFFFGR